jgi:hypothetical protein
MNLWKARYIQGLSMVYAPLWMFRTTLKGSRLTSGGVLAKTSEVMMLNAIFLPRIAPMKGGCDA